MPEALNFIKKESLAQVFSCEFCEISKNTFFTEYLQTTASEVGFICLNEKALKVIFRSETSTEQSLLENRKLLWHLLFGTAIFSEELFGTKIFKNELLF